MLKSAFPVPFREIRAIRGYPAVRYDPNMPDIIEVLIEIPRGSRNKYEWDDKRGVLRLDRTLYSSVHYPTDYGYIPNTHADDGDHLDVLVIVEEPTLPGCYLDARPIGVLRMRDDKGGDDKIICVPVADPRFADVLSSPISHRTGSARSTSSSAHTRRCKASKSTSTAGAIVRRHGRSSRRLRPRPAETPTQGAQKRSSARAIDKASTT